MVDIQDDEDLVEHFEFLDKLRDAGHVNMFGAAPYLADMFDLTMPEARKILLAWQGTFDGVTSAVDRAAIAQAS